MVSQGMKVDLICLKENEKEPTRENCGGVEVFRVPLKRRRGGKFGYVFQYGLFILICFLMAASRSLRRYRLVHVHNMPDVLVFSAMIPKIFGARVLLDLHDPMPELMTTIFGLRPDSFSVRALRWTERLSIGFANRVATVNLACKKIFSARSCRPEKIHVVMNSPDEKTFPFKPYAGAGIDDPARPFIIMYHGSIVARHGLDLAVQALGIVRKTIPTAELRIYGPSTPFLEEVMRTVQSSGLGDGVRSYGASTLDQIAQAIDKADLGIIPNRRSIFTEINTPTRIFEYLSRGKPVIAPAAPGIEDYFGPDELIYFELGNAEDLARQILRVISHPEEIAQVVVRGQEVYKKHRWSAEREGFLGLIKEMVGVRA